jgi:hypothetical protein
LLGKETVTPTETVDSSGPAGKLMTFFVLVR